MPQLKVGASYTRRLRLREKKFEDDDSDIQEILAACGAFIRLRSGIASIVHHTFETFITSQNDCGNRLYPDPYQTRHLRILASVSYLSNLSIPRIDNIFANRDRRNQWDRMYPLFRESWSESLYYLGRATFNGNIAEMCQSILELAKAISTFSSPGALNVGSEAF